MEGNAVRKEITAYKSRSTAVQFGAATPSWQQNMQAHKRIPIEETRSSIGRQCSGISSNATRSGFLFLRNPCARLSRFVEGDCHSLFTACNFLAAPGFQGSFLMLLHYLVNFSFPLLEEEVFLVAM
jgi:hypothetical protein